MKDWKAVYDELDRAKKSLSLDSLSITTQKEGYMSELERCKDDLHLMNILDKREDLPGGCVAFVHVLKDIYLLRKNMLTSARKCYQEWETYALAKDELDGRISALEFILAEEALEFEIDD